MIKIIHFLALGFIALNFLNTQEITSINKLYGIENQTIKIKDTNIAHNYQKKAGKRNPNKYLIDSSHYSTWSNYNNDWVLGERDFNKYTSFGSIENNIKLHFRNQFWKNYSQMTYVYNSNNALVIEDFQTLDSNNNFNIDSKIEYTYDKFGNQTEKKLFSWDKIDQSWKQYDRYSYTYNSNHQRIEELIQLWSDSTQNFKNFLKYNYTFNGNNDNDKINCFTWIESKLSWCNSAQVISKYNSQHLKTEFETQNLTCNDGTIYDRRLAKLTYDHNDMLTLQSWHSWDANKWIENTSITKYINTYDSDNNLIELIVQIWHPLLQTFINAQKFNYFYSVHDVTTSTINKATINFSISPNPSQDFIMINGINISAKISIYDLNSQLLKHSQYEDRIDISELASGIYFINIKNNGLNQTLKFCKI